jgi:prepilin-type N-terminal cleavage/methylation domain-containing protein
VKQLNYRDQSKGFTLMEIVIVFILLGILAVAVIPAFTSMDDVGYQATQEGALGTLRTSWTVAFGDSKRDPTLDQIVAKVDTCSCADGAGITCTDVLQTDGTNSAEFGVGTADSVVCASTASAPSSIVILDS